MWKVRAILFSAPAIVLVTAFMATIAAICSIWDDKGQLQHRIARAWSRMLLRLAFIDCRVAGVDKLKPGGTYVLVSNHSSYMDIPVMLSSMPLEVRFFAKKGLFAVPFIGWHLARAGHLPVVRGDARASLKSMSEGAKLIRERRISVLLFPEGGRTEPALGIRPFKEGAAYIAIKAGVPVVPVGLNGVNKVLPMHTLLLHPGQVEVRCGEPIETANMTLRDRERLNDMLYERVSELAGKAAVSAT